jgi:rRNA maturation RNase YbeY
VIQFYDEGISLPNLDFESIRKWVESVIESSGFILGEISYIFCNDEYLYEINLKYLNHNFYTDIITFNYNEDKYISGDLFISVDRVLDNANTLGIEVNQEFLRVMIHGVLHLLGNDDKTIEERNKMRMEENKYIYHFLNAKNV